jgi:hypothetical protein
MFKISSLLALLLLVGCKTADIKNSKAQKPDVQLIDVPKAKQSPRVDGIANETIWNEQNSWHPIDQLWLGNPYTSNDYQGLYKLCWTKEAVFILVEITDDIMYDQTKDPLKLWWDDDCVEVFVDEDNSGGEHQFNHNAFAYHVALNGNVVDMSPEKVGKLYNNHVESKHTTTGNTTIWELKLSIFDDTYDDNGSTKPVNLSAEKKIGFAIAYCDNDTSPNRENFIGSIAVEGEDKDRGWIDANIFGTLLLKD